MGDKAQNSERIQFKEGKVKKLVITAFLVLVLTMMLAVPAMAAAPTLHKVTAGGGMVGAILFPAEGIFSNWGFTAQQINESGDAKGEFVCWFRMYDPDIYCKADILYLAVDGNEAWLGGIITQSNFAPMSVGMGCLFKVVDNGQGSSATGPDRFSFFWYDIDPADALLMPDIPTPIELVRGDIQVS